MRLLTPGGLSTTATAIVNLNLDTLPRVALPAPAPTPARRTPQLPPRQAVSGPRILRKPAQIIHHEREEDPADYVAGGYLQVCIELCLYMI